MNRQQLSILLDGFVSITKKFTSKVIAMPISGKTKHNFLNANTKFAFKLFSQTLEQDKNKNVFISPTSVAIALSLLYNGAEGTTQKQMAQVLELQGLQLEELNKAYQNLQTNLENQADIELSIANSIWLRKGFPIESKFLENNKQYYQAEITELDFNQSAAKTIINNWVNKKTKGKITEIIDEITPENVLFLINAIYFKGTWTKKFNRQLTEQQPFYLEKDNKIQHPLMSQNGKKMYYQNEDFQAIQLPYGKNTNLNMYIFLPKINSNINSFMEKLNAENWQKWQANFTQKEGLISLPKFKLKYEITLNKTLKDLGMTEIFTNQANFKNMTSGKVKVDKVKHKTFVEVNEKGTEAAAVTSISTMTKSANKVNLNERFQMIVNRPFFYAIADNKTGTILFMGKMLHPR